MTDIYAGPSTEFESVAEHFPSGLEGTIGVQIRDNTGAVVLARTTAGIVEEEIGGVGTGVYRVTLTAPGEAGQYTVMWDTGVVTPSNVGIDQLVVTSSAVIDVLPIADGPVLGPCSSWIDSSDVLACCQTSDQSSDTIAALSVAAVEASMALFEISGRQFSGLCGRTVRPSAQQCGCWGSRAAGLGPWAWSAAAYGYAGGAWGWWNECGDRLGCSPMSRVKLAGYPVRSISEVKIDGAVLAATDDDGNPNYRLDGWRFLTRMDSPGPPVEKRYWPGCQNMALDDTEDGTFSVTYVHGVEPPELGRRAAAALACELYKQCAGGECALPAGVTRLNRQGVQVERQLLANWFDPKKGTGVPAIDLFLRAYWTGKATRRPAVFSPDLQPYAKRMGT